MIARGQLGHNSAVGGMQGHLTVQGLGQDFGLAAQPGRQARASGRTNKGNTCLVAGGLNAQDQKPLSHLPEFPGLAILVGSPGASPLLPIGWTFTMPVVRVKENEPFEAALRRFKRTIEKIGLLTELRAREFYEKPTAERKRKKAAAVKRHYKRVRSMMLPKRKY